MIALFQFGDYTVCMYSKIVQLRHRGVRRPDRDISNDTGVSGTVTLHCVGGHLRLAVNEWGVHRPGSELLPDLWDARCMGWNSGSMIWHGYQHARLGDQKGQPVYFQEWTIEIIDMYPPQDQIKSIFHARNGEPAAFDQVPPVP
jgi:hypothetical protein